MGLESVFNLVKSLKRRLAPSLLVVILLYATGSRARAQSHSSCWLRDKSGYSVNYYGANPTTAQLQAELKTWAAYYQVPIEIAAAVSYQESVGAFQFDADGYPGPYHSASGFV